MACKQCSSDNQSTFVSEMDIRCPGLKGLDQPIVWVFPKLKVCLECGFAEFEIPEGELRALAQSARAVAEVA
jgi:hypothetical protein